MKSTVTRTVTTDLLVVGSGAGALTAAIVAADLKLDVIVIEKSDLFGGTSATSGGVIWIPASHLARSAGAQDSAEEAFAYIKALAGGDADDERINAFVTEGPKMLEYLVTNTEVRYSSIPYTDYHAELPGGKLGWRSHDPVPLDGRELGKDLERLQPPHQSTMLFGRIAWTAAEAAPMITRSKGWIPGLLRALWRYYGDIGQRFRSARGRYLTGGNALVGRLKLSLDKRGVPLWHNTRLVKLMRGTNRVEAAIIEQNGTMIEVRLNRGIVLAAGGFERNPALRAASLTAPTNSEWSGSQPANTGDAILAAQAIGAQVERMDSAWWAPTVVVPGEDRARPLFFERSLPGCLIVNQAGRRYMNEAASYHIAGQTMVQANRPEAPTSPSYILFDSTFRWRYPMGPVMPMVPDFLHSEAVRSILVKGSSWAELARKLEVDPAVLEQTIARFNEHARSGDDPDFHRGQQPYDRYYGDPRVTPNPNLKAIEKPPFYALPIYPGDIGTSGGLRTNAHAQVIGSDGMPIEGLYAIGNSSSSVMGRSYPGAGATIGPAMTFAFVASRHASGASRGTGSAWGPLPNNDVERTENVD
jgi:3-oxosteroid 1-dehydrogenase